MIILLGHNYYILFHSLNNCRNKRITEKLFRNNYSKLSPNNCTEINLKILTSKYFLILYFYLTFKLSRNMIIILAHNYYTLFLSWNDDSKIIST